MPSLPPVCQLDYVSGTSLVVQWLRPCTGGKGLIPGWGNNILHAERCGQKKPELCTEKNHHIVGA